MKKLLYLLFFTFSLSVKSQITFDGSIIGGGEHFTTTSLGDKYFDIKSNFSIYHVDTLIIYNKDFSVYRRIITPFDYSYIQLGILNGYLPSISDKLFNSDTLLEFLCSKNLSGSGTGDNLISVVNELGQILYTFPDTIFKTVNLFMVEGDFKINYSTYHGGVYKVFSLPGSLPCNQCNYVSGITEPNPGGVISELKVYPNPFDRTLEINYDFFTRQDNPRLIFTDLLGRELKSLSLSNQSDKITLITSDLPRGTITVSLLGSGQNVISKKVIKIE